MILSIDGLEVVFPFESIYPEQYEYMLELKRVLDARGHAVLEMPCGTGKTISLLSVILSYALKHPHAVSRLIYCSRTVPEIEKVLEELSLLFTAHKKETGSHPRVLAIGLSARKNLCIHPEVCKESDGRIVDGKCQQMTSSLVREQRRIDPTLSQCDFFERFESFGKDSPIPDGVYTLEGLKTYGKAKGLCPYFLARNALLNAKIIVYSYYYLLDPKIAEIVSKEIPRNSVIVFDEAHNIDNVCVESMSVKLTRTTLAGALKNLQTLSSEIERIKQEDANKLRQEYLRLVVHINGRLI